MAYTVAQLISGAYYKSGIVSRQFGTVSGDQKSVGLDELNKALADKAVAEYLIPYYTKYNFNGVIGQESYTIANLIDVETLTFTIGSVRFPVGMIGRNQYFGTSRANNVNSLPYTAHFEPQFGGGNLYLYFKPADTYTFELWGRFRLGTVTYNQDLSSTFDLFYIDFLENLLAVRLCSEFNFVTPQPLADSVARFYKIFKNQIAPLDTNINKISTLQHRTGPDIYGDANIARGWRPTYQ